MSKFVAILYFVLTARINIGGTHYTVSYCLLKENLIIRNDQVKIKMFSKMPSFSSVAI